MTKFISASAVFCALLMSACGGGGGGGPTTYALGGTVVGLAAGGQFVLLSGAGTQTTITANGNFRFGDRLPDGTRYALQVQQQPLNQTCQVSNGTNSTGIKADVSTVTVTCADNPAVLGGALSGLPSGTSVTVANGAQSSVTLSANGPYALPGKPAAGTPYNITVTAQPTGASCVVLNGSGSAGTAPIGNINIQCSRATLAIGGELSGLALGSQVQLKLAGSGVTSGALTLTVNGGFNFPSPISFGGDYAVTIDGQPAGQTCTLSNDKGAAVTVPVTQVRVTCAGNRHALGGSVSGLGATVAGQPLVLRNGPELLTVNANGPFRFPTLLADGASYTVSIASQPTGQTCQVLNESASAVSGPVSTVTVQCLSFVWRSRLVAGSGVSGNVDEVGAFARLAAPAGVALGPLGDLFITDFSSSRIRSVALPMGAVSTTAGSGVPGLVNSVAPLAASFRGPVGIAVDGAGNIYVADSGNHVIRLIVAGSREVRTFAGSGVAGANDGPAAIAQFNNPRGLALDAQGNLYVADAGNHAIRKVSPSGQVSLYAGRPGTSGKLDGDLLNATFHAPSGIAVNAQGAVFIADTLNHSIRMVAAGTTQVITVAGSGMPGAQDGTGSFASFSLPAGLAAEGPATLYVADAGNHAVRVVQIASGSGAVLTIAGIGRAGYQEGIGRMVALDQPTAVALDAAGSLIVTEGGGHRVRSLYRSPN